MEVGLNEATANLMTQLFLGENRLLFDGPLRELDWHRHSFACVLIGVDGPIVITGPSKEDEKVGRVVLAGAAAMRPQLRKLEEISPFFSFQRRAQSGWTGDMRI